MKKILFFLTVILTFATAQSQTKRALFLGNSYTYVNNLPQMIANAALSTGDILSYDSHAPGGYYLGQHATDSVSLNKIKIGNWDYVVLQDQSMSYAYPPPYFYQMPSAHKLDSIIRVYNNCVQTLLYTTWGRKNGDSYFCPAPACPADTVITRTYYQMDSAIQINYMFVADSLRAMASPVGAVWRYIRRNHPTIELFQPDDSHPSEAGTYAAACCFYTTIFRKDPTLISFNSTLSAADAADIRHAAKVTVYDNLLYWNIGKYDSIVNAACITSIQNRFIHSVFKIYPNPTNRSATLEFNNDTKQSCTLELYNSRGQMVRTVNSIVTDKIEIQTQELSNGLYLFRLLNNKQIFATGKLAIE
ncbi:MAG: T9SS type A sorting domain-containing protein [Bacteroidota bacterium]